MTEHEHVPRIRLYRMASRSFSHDVATLAALAALDLDALMDLNPNENTLDALAAYQDAQAKAEEEAEAREAKARAAQDDAADDDEGWYRLVE
jgi:hypothetical protein